jgi:hypothetical protein
MKSLSVFHGSAGPTAGHGPGGRTNAGKRTPRVNWAVPEDRSQDERLIDERSSLTQPDVKGNRCDPRHLCLLAPVLSRRGLTLPLKQADAQCGWESLCSYV